MCLYRLKSGQLIKPRINKNFVTHGVLLILNSHYKGPFIDYKSKGNLDCILFYRMTFLLFSLGKKANNSGHHFLYIHDMLGALCGLANAVFTVALLDMYYYHCYCCFTGEETEI